jgi:hypothetical protein
MNMSGKRVNKRKPDPHRVQKLQKHRAKRWNAILDRLPEGVELVGAEVGVWTGDTCSQLLPARPQLFLYLVDRWCPPTKDDSYFHSGAKIAGYTQTKHEEAHHLTVSKVKPYEDRVKYLIGNTVDMADEIEDNSLDFAFIDADHSYEGVLGDLKAYLPKIKIGGWIGGHDWNAKWETEKAVLEMFPRNRVELDVNSTWFIRL